MDGPTKYEANFAKKENIASTQGDSNHPFIRAIYYTNTVQHNSARAYIR